MPFHSTIWTQIGAAQKGSREALELVLQQYRPPLLRFFQSRGLSEHDAEDVVQDVFLEICGEDFLARADRTKGRFRSLLLRVAQNVLNSNRRKRFAAKRGGGQAALSLDEGRTSESESDGTFDAEWARNLVRLALDRMRRDDSRAKAPYADLLEARFLRGASSVEIGIRFGVDRAQVDRLLHRGKTRLQRHLAELTGDYSSSPEEHAEEVDLASRFLKD